MMGSFLSRALILVFGYAYPAYECFKVVEQIKPNMEQVLFWCRYWILVAVLTVCERVGDNIVSWLPMYSEAKLAFFVYLWYPKTEGTEYVYNCLFRPVIIKNEAEIDRNLLVLKVKASEIVLGFWHIAASYGQEKFFDILQYISSQSPLQSHGKQQEANVEDGEAEAHAFLSSSIDNKVKGDQPGAAPPPPPPCAELDDPSTTATMVRQAAQATIMKAEKVANKQSSSPENKVMVSSRHETSSPTSAIRQTDCRWHLFRRSSSGK